MYEDRKLKTTKLTYVVECYDEKSIIHSVDCVTLAEARLIASRSFRAVIKPVGKIEYQYGIELQDFSFVDELKKEA